MRIPTKGEFHKGIKEFKKHEKRDAMYKVATFLVSHFWSKTSDMADGLGVLLLTWNQAFYRYGIFDFDKLEECITNNFQEIENFRNRNISSFSSSDEDDVEYLFYEFLEALQIETVKFSDKNKKKYTKKELLNFLARLQIRLGINTSLSNIYNTIKSNPNLKNAVEFEKSNKNYVLIKIGNLMDAEIKILESPKLIPRSPVAVAKALHLLAPSFFPLWDSKIARTYGCYYSDKPAEKYISFCKIMKSVVREVKNYIRTSQKSFLKLIDEYNYSKYTRGWI